MFYIVAPLSRNIINDFNYLKEADEFYFGIVKGNKSETEILNKRWHIYANFDLNNNYHINILKLINKYKKQLKFKLNLVLNNAYWNIDFKILDKLLDIVKIDAFIVKDPILIYELYKKYSNISINLSSLALISNIKEVKNLKSFKNIKRIILHRDIDEDTFLLLLPYLQKYEIEMFTINEWCYNVDWLCFSRHNLNEPFVCFRQSLLIDNKKLKQNISNKINCQLCLLKILNERIKNIYKDKNLFNFVKFFKISWRWNDIKILKKYINITKKFLINLENINKKNIIGIFNEENIKTEKMFCKKCWYYDNYLK